MITLLVWFFLIYGFVSFFAHLIRIARRLRHVRLRRN